MAAGTLPQGEFHPIAKRGLYALADADAAEKRGLDVVDCARAMAAAEVPYLQLRAKARSAEVQTRWLESIERHTSSSTRLIMNDRADVAALVGASGVHVGQSDLGANAIREAFPELVVGCSTHDLAQLRQALAESSLHYVAFGPIYSTASKRNAENPVGLHALRTAKAAAASANVPLVAIGGVEDETLREVAGACDYLAAISLLLPAPGTARPYEYIEKRCRELHSRIQGEVD